jgi:signal transduction histidine kinase
LEDFDLAETYIQKAITISEKTENDNINLLANVKLAEQKRAEKDYDKALEYIEVAVRIAKKINSNYQISRVLLEKGSIIKHGFDDLQKAEALYLEAYSYAKKSQEKYAIRTAILELYGIYLSQGNYTESKKYLDKLEEIEKTSDNILTAKDWHFAAGQYYKITNKNDKKALFHYLEYYKLKDSTDNLGVRKKLADLEKKFDTKSKELQISNLEIENKKQELLTKEAAFKQRIYLIVVLIAITFLLIGLWIYLKLKKQKQKLDQVNKDLSELNKVKDHLFSILAHDLRSMILPFQRVGKIMKYHIDKDNYSKAVALSSELERNSQNLSDVLNNLLSWSLEQMNNYKVNLTKISIANELQDITEGFKQHASYKNTEITIDCDTTEMFFDKGAFHLIFRNLIGNALKYTENGTVKITAINRDNDITFTVEDNGVGIDPEKATKIFSLEKEQSTVGTKGEKGTGLGLNLVHRFVKLHRGNIDVTPRKPKGTAFHLFFPDSAKSNV